MSKSSRYVRVELGPGDYVTVTVSEGADGWFSANCPRCGSPRREHAESAVVAWAQSHGRTAHGRGSRPAAQPQQQNQQQRQQSAGGPADRIPNWRTGR
jgi:hypothetical protein